MSRPLVFLHGWGLHGGIWDTVREALPGRTVYTPDLPGYGATPAVHPYTAEALADALAGQLPAGCVLVGWSLGGMVALALAARHPDCLRGLVLVGGSPAFVNRDGWAHGLEVEVVEGFAAGLRENYRGTLLRFLSLQARGDEAARLVIERLRQTVFARGEPDSTALSAGLGLLREVDLRDAAVQVRRPALVVHGGQDTLCPAEAGRWLASHIPGARLALHERASHAPFLSHPAWFTDVLTEFLDGLDE